MGILAPHAPGQHAAMLHPRCGGRGCVWARCRTPARQPAGPTGSPSSRQPPTHVPHLRPAHSLCSIVQVRNPKGDAGEAPKSFTFDQVYDWTCLQRDVFEITAVPIIDSAIEGYNGEGGLVRATARSGLGVLLASSAPWRLAWCAAAWITASMQKRCGRACVCMRASMHPMLLPAHMFQAGHTMHAIRHACRHNLCIWPDGYRQVPHHGGQGRTIGAARSHPQQLPVCL